MARREQTAHSDQDNGMILSDAYNEAEHGDYFRAIAKYVSDGLNACGYVYCPVMSWQPMINGGNRCRYGAGISPTGLKIRNLKP